MKKLLFFLFVIFTLSITTFAQNEVSVTMFKSEISPHNMIDCLVKDKLFFEVDSIYPYGAYYIGAIYKGNSLQFVKATKDKVFNIDLSGVDNINEYSFKFFSFESFGNIKPIINLIEKRGTMTNFSYQNPIQLTQMPAGTGFRDPAIILVGDTYYMTGTKYPYFDAVGLGEVSGVDLYSSKDLVNWKFEANLLERPNIEDGKWYQNYFWAPEIYQTNGKFYLTVNASKRQTPNQIQEMGIWVADDIKGPYKALNEFQSLKVGNDASIFTDDDGKNYLLSSGLEAVEIDLSTGTTIGNKFEIVKSNSTPAQFDSVGCEGPYIIKRDGIYYCFYSTWTRGYEIGYATATNIKGPWTRCDKPLYGGLNVDWINRWNSTYGWNMIYDPSIYSHSFKEVGHNSVFQGPDGNDYIAAHVYASQDDLNNHKVTLAIDKLIIDNGVITIANSPTENGPTDTPQTIDVSTPYTPIPLKAINVFDTVVKGQDYSMPKQVNLLMTNGRKQQRAVSWSGNVNSSQAGTQTLVGTVHYAGQSFTCTLNVMVADTLSIAPINVNVLKNSTYKMPKFVNVTLDNGYIMLYKVIWESAVDTSIDGTQTINGTIPKINRSCQLIAEVGLNYVVSEDFNTNAVNPKATRLALFTPALVGISNNQYQSNGGTGVVGFWDTHYENYTFSANAQIGAGTGKLFVGTHTGYPAGHPHLDGGIWFGFSKTGTNIELIAGNPLKLINVTVGQYDLSTKKKIKVVENNNEIKLYVDETQLLSLTVGTDRKTVTVGSQSIVSNNTITVNGYAAVCTIDIVSSVDDLYLKAIRNATTMYTESFDDESMPNFRLAIPTPSATKVENGYFSNAINTVTWGAVGYTIQNSGKHSFSALIRIPQTDTGTVRIGTAVAYPAGFSAGDGGLWFELNNIENKINIIAGLPNKTATIDIPFDIGTKIKEFTKVEIVADEYSVRFYYYDNSVRLNAATVKLSSDKKTLDVYNFYSNKTATITLDSPLNIYSGYSVIHLHFSKSQCDDLMLTQMF